MSDLKHVILDLVQKHLPGPEYFIVEVKIERGVDKTKILILVDADQGMTIASCAKWIWQKDGIRGFYRGVTPRIGLSTYLTVCMVFGGDEIKAYFAK